MAQRRKPRTERRGPSAQSPPGSTRLVSLDEIRVAAQRIRGVARVTPLVDVTLPDTPAVWLKCENLQPVGAFKIRGAYNMIARLAPDQLARGVVTYSSGNHGQAVAYVAKRLGAQAVIVMPRDAPQLKVERTRMWGAEVIFEGTTSADRKIRAEAEAAARGLTIVPPFDHPWIIAGQGTAGLEIFDACPDVTRVFVPIGGGGLIAGVAAALKRLKPLVRIIGVEPEGAAKMKAALDAGHPVTLPTATSIADGLIPVRVGDLTFAHARALIDEVVTVSEEQIRSTVAWLCRNARLVVEPSGAASVAAVLADRAAASGDQAHPHPGARRRAPDLHHGPTVAVVSGGNIDPGQLARLLESA